VLVDTPQSPHVSERWLRDRFAAPRNVAPVTIGDGHLFRADREIRPAAVLVPVVRRDDDLTVLFTRRTSHLHDHAGQISFPGGRTEPDDASASDTALRETAEEIGLAPGHVEVLGHLTDYTTVTGYRVTPVVGLVSSPFELKLDDFEVAEVFEVPLAFLLDPANHQRNLLIHDGRERHYYAMPYGPYYIWGATAGMLMNFYAYLTRAE
jgi:8-oxo-dGTP pyrophosphatase MutT (NUDIX family)